MALAEPVAGLVVDHHVSVVAQRAVGGVPGGRGEPPAGLVDDHVAADPAAPHAAALRGEARHRAGRRQPEGERAAAGHRDEPDALGPPAARVRVGLLGEPAELPHARDDRAAGAHAVAHGSAYVDPVLHRTGACRRGKSSRVPGAPDGDPHPHAAAHVLGDEAVVRGRRAADGAARAQPLVADAGRVGRPATRGGGHHPGEALDADHLGQPPVDQRARGPPSPSAPTLPGRSSRRWRSRSPAPTSGGRGRRAAAGSCARAHRGSAHRRAASDRRRPRRPGPRRPARPGAPGRTSAYP